MNLKSQTYKEVRVYKLILARHGSAFDAYDKIDQEEDIFRQTKSTPLSQLGISQANLLGRQLSIYNSTHPIDFMVNSEYRRARTTAEIIAEYCTHLMPNAIPDLNEIPRIVDGESIYSQLNLDYKQWRGKTIKEGDLNAKFHPSDMSFGEFFTNTTKLKYWYQKEFDGQTGIVVGHSQSHAMFITSALLGDKPKPRALFDSFNRRFMSHAAYSILTWDHRKGWQMKEEDFNITKHLK